MKQHTVEAGECIASIAHKYGFGWETIWNFGENSGLKEKRKDPNTLVPGDIVSVPDRTEKVASCETEKVHRFKLKSEDVMFRLQLFEDEKPLASLDFELQIRGIAYKGTTTDKGVLELTIPGDAQEGMLTIGPDKKMFELHFGYLLPVSEKDGLLARLHNLGFIGELDESLRSFQKRFGLEVTGQADQATMDKLTSMHDVVCDYPE